MRKSPYLALGTLFLGVVGLALLLLVLTTPPTAAPPVPTTATFATVTPCFNCQAARNITPTPYEVASQCEKTGEAYELRVANLGGTAGSYNYPSPDGKFALIKENAIVYLKDVSTGALEQIAQESDTISGIDYRARWSPDSHAVLFTPQNSEHPLLIPANISAPPIPLEKATIDQFYDWSPNSQYIVVHSTDPGVALSAIDTQTNQSVYDIQQPYQSWGSAPVWSPDSQWLAYISGDYPYPNAELELTVVLGRIGSSEQYTFPMGAIQTDNRTNRNLIWSPDSKKVVLYYTVPNPERPNSGTEHFDVFTTSNQYLPALAWEISVGAHPYPLDRGNPDNRPRWDPSSEFFAALHYYYRDGLYALVHYYPADGKTITLADNLYHPTFYTPNPNRIALYTYLGADEKNYQLLAINFMDWNGDHPVNFVENVNNAGNPDWSPNGEWVAVVWSRENDDFFTTTLTWMHPDGSERHDLQANFTDVRDLRWLPNDQLAYLAWRKDSGNNLETVDLKTGERHVLAEGFQNMPHITYDANTNQLSFMWYVRDGDYGLDSYTPDGTRISRVLVSGETLRPFKTFWSPDGKTVLLKVGELTSMSMYGELLTVGYADGRPSITLRSGLDGLGDPLWSPDSRQFAFTQWVDFQLSLEVFSPDGDLLYETRNVGIGYPLVWIPCT